MTEPGGVFYGAHAAIVTENRDPEGMGRVRIRLPWAPDAAGGSFEAWARTATLISGSKRRTGLNPNVNDEVLVVFEAGDLRHPYVIGVLWNGQDSPPASMDGDGQSETKVIRSRNGLEITMNERDGQESLTVRTLEGQTITLSEGRGRVEIVDSNGNAVTLESSGITVTASAAVTVNTSTVKVSAGMVSVDAGMAQFSGVVKCETLVANSVVASSYTPGAGNIW